MINSQPKQHLELETDSTLVLAELDRLLRERRFAGAPQMSAFLRYIVNETLDGNASRIKAFSVGVDALGKPDDFDAQTDPSVRVLALRLRKTLDTIYEDTSAALVIIKLKVGTYVPMFYAVNKASERSASDAQQSRTSNVVAQITSRPIAAPRRERGDKVGSVHMEQRSTRSLNEGSATTSRARFGLSGGVLTESRQANNKWLMVAAAALLVAAWQMAVKNSDAQAGVYTEAPQLMNESGAASVLVQADSVLDRATARQQPTIVVGDVDKALEFERRIVLMLTSNFIEDGAIGVIKASDGLVSWVSRPGEYQLLVTSYHVADEVRVNAQLVSLWDGEMLFTETVVLHEVRHFFSDEDITTIESLATGLTSTDGPLFEDYCARHATQSEELGSCSTT